jgi:hypothetical protein
MGNQKTQENAGFPRISLTMECPAEGHVERTLEQADPNRKVAEVKQ